MMLIFEAVSLLFILVLGVAIWVHKGFAVDMDQVTLHGTTPGGVITGILLVVFAFSGFESSTSLGTEAKDPLRAIPRSLLQSTAVALSALITFFVPAAVSLSGINAFDAQGYFGTLCSFGFLPLYILVSVAAPIYLRSLGQLGKVDILYSVLGCGFMPSSLFSARSGYPEALCFLRPLSPITCWFGYSYFIWLSAWPGF
jgi:amino acid transporter